MDLLIDLLEGSDVIFLGIVALISLCVGSFLNVVIHRTPLIMEKEWKTECSYILNQEPIIDYEKITLSKPSSSCPKCKSKIKWFQNIPVISWIALKGSCATCKNKISFRYPMVEILTMIVGVLVGIKFGVSLATVFGLIFVYAVISLSFIDYDTQLLPDRITLPIAGLGLAVNSYGMYVDASTAIWGCLIGFLCLWSVYYLFKIVSGKEGMGFGDFKMLAMLGAWFGFKPLLLVIVLASFIGMTIGFIAMKIQKESKPFAFGYSLGFAGIVAFIWGDQIINAYMEFATI